ncbi:MAG: twin-arginine translocase TatA/TatE family subunit [Bacteroidales bacterium]|nr:twin-arginine translocase TatA/TatE family subunit [Bacteroidales bacterium]
MFASILNFFNIGWGEILIIALIILLLFGGKKIPELMKGIGKGVSSFKKGMNDIEDEIKKPIDEPAGKKDDKAE